MNTISKNQKWISLVLKCVVILSAIIGTIMSYLAGRYSFMSGVVSVKRSNALYVIIPPILYAIYAGVGYVKGWEFAEGINYPYFFLNWGSKAGAFGFTSVLPFMGSAWWILALLIFLIIVGYAYLAIADVIGNRKGR